MNELTFYFFHLIFFAGIVLCLLCIMCLVCMMLCMMWCCVSLGPMFAVFGAVFGIVFAGVCCVVLCISQGSLAYIWPLHAAQHNAHTQKLIQTHST